MARQLDSDVIDAPSKPVSKDLTEKRYVYGGDAEPNTTAANRAQGAPVGNRPVKRRKRSPFNMIFSVIIVSALIVFYVWNKISVNRLVVEVNDLHSQYQKIVNTNEMIRAEINRKSNLERIGKLAAQAGMVYPREQPTWFAIDEDRLDDLRNQP